MNDRINNLKNFINFLSHHGLINKNSLHDEGDEGFINRLKLQKLVYLAQTKFEWDLGYDFSIYKYGPYSPTLADDYYDESIDLAGGADDNYTTNNEYMENQFLEIVGEADPKRLETAATLLSLSYHFKDKDLLINRIMNMKPYIPKNDILDVYEDLIYHNLIQ